MTATTNAENLRQYQIRFSLIAEQILAFASHRNIVREVKIYLQISSNLRRYLRLLKIFIWIVRSILLLNSKQFTKNYTEIACI